MPRSRCHLQVRPRSRGKGYVLSVATETKTDHGSASLTGACGVDSRVVAPKRCHRHRNHSPPPGTPCGFRVPGTNKALPESPPVGQSFAFPAAPATQTLPRTDRVGPGECGFVHGLIRALARNAGDLSSPSPAWGLVGSRRGLALRLPSGLFRSFILKTNEMVLLMTCRPAIPSYRPAAHGCEKRRPLAQSHTSPFLGPGFTDSHAVCNSNIHDSMNI